jgi:uncharacterized protein YlxW (UPF0749 family)
MLDEANAEMALIAAEKKEYFQKWKSSIIAMSRRDEAVKSAERLLREEGERQQSLESEIQGYKTSIRSEQEQVRTTLFRPLSLCLLAKV